MLTQQPAKELINETYRILKNGLQKGITYQIPDSLTAALDRDTFIFSGCKTYHQLQEASRLLKNNDRGFKTFDNFRKDIEHIHNTYNRAYLQAEYNFAVQSAQMAAKWNQFEKDGDRYLLQYRTAGDDRVREDHAALQGITLPINDQFWDNYYPPLGWNCRCTVVQVRKGKYPITDSQQAIAAGQQATASPKQQIFRFNPGKQQKVFPPKHPYYKAPTPAKDIINKEQRIGEIMQELPNNISDDTKRAIALNCIDIEEKMGIKKQKPMSIEDADRQSANPHHVLEYIPDSKGKYMDPVTKERFNKNPNYNPKRDKPFSINCQTCAPAYVLRLRGFDVKAKGNTPDSLSDYLSRQHSFEAWLNADGSPCTPLTTYSWMVNKGYAQMTAKRYRDYFEEACKEEGVYILTIAWKHGGAHATILQRFKDGSLKYIEPQEYNVSLGAVRPIDELCDSGTIRPTPKRGILRVDDKIFNTKFISIFEQ
ncbi:MAG: toxin glutamine deamidase domain-containing protein [Paludibacter sp.]|nr:toxin glutamine deamidase domain-containing protein [Bacteroidales bacterium]MCM1069840.1 toxin glutamine deamidase domain-containing protein [Prevotella sp.]MCM1353967.1 toxin glutamine deamidase domain-containing protein [Bacteroides sp.]MCM1443391.1 toxin glutamine deamidase domain-containing protein [Muribaculum sp.]MCM1482094.1 toxin glutamine deamidase domain-containing protein [Paludibacter sp.]